MRVTHRLKEHTALMIAEIHNSLRVAHKLCNEIKTDPSSPQGVVTEFNAVGASTKNCIDRITARIPECRMDAFNDQIATADPLGFENIKSLWFKLPADKKEMIENAMLLSKNGIDFILKKV